MKYKSTRKQCIRYLLTCPTYKVNQLYEYITIGTEEFNKFKKMLYEELQVRKTE